MERNEWELFLLKLTWWLDYSDESYNTVATTLHGIKISMTHDKLMSLEMKHSKRASVLAGG